MGKLVRLVVSFAILFTCAGRVAAQASSDPFVRWAKAHAVPLRTVEAGGDNGDLRPLVAMVGTARVVAMGEAAHGAHEPLALRNRIFKFLVERMGFTAIAIESGITESQRVQSFVLGDAGIARDVVHDNLTWGFGELAENVALVQWMRDYNADPSHRRKIRFYGVDLSAGEGGAFGRARIAVDGAVSYLARTDTASARQARAALEPYLDRFSSTGYPTISPAERDRLSAAIAELVAQLERGRARYVAATSEDDYEWALHNAEVAVQLDAFFRVVPLSPVGGGLAPTFYRAMNVRDSAMAVNLEWVLEREGPSGRVMVFAHDAHVMNGNLTGPLWKSFAEAPTQMGARLRQSLGRQLFTVATSSAHNASDLPKATLDSAGIDAALERVGLPLFVLDLRDVRRSPAAFAWLAERHTLRINFDTYADVRADSAFDALIFVDTLTKSRGQP